MKEQSAFERFCEIKKIQGVEPKNFTIKDFGQWSWFQAGYRAAMPIEKELEQKEFKQIFEQRGKNEQ